MLCRLNMNNVSVSSKLVQNYLLFPVALGIRKSSTDIKKTCLHEFHRSRNAKIEPFAGYLMPIFYKNQSIQSEHLFTRSDSSMFDVSHMLQTIVTGKDRFRYLESLTVADLEGLQLNKCVLTLFTNESGGIIDDCIISNRPDHLHIVSNAANSDIVWSLLNRNIPPGVDVKIDRLSEHGLMALQGPKAAQVLQKLVKIDLADVLFMNSADADIPGVGVCQVTRCGYTGEDGFEISVAANRAMDLVDTLCRHDTVQPAGLGARDTLRLEAGLCLHGHDMTADTTPIEAALAWTVAKRRRVEGRFPGSDVILKQLKEGAKLTRVGLISEIAGPPAREKSTVVSDKTPLGKITSGTFSPTLRKNIAMAYVSSNFLNNNEESKVMCQIRNRQYDYHITKLPFVKPNYYLKRK